jgi:hypothetical protein
MKLPDGSPTDDDVLARKRSLLAESQNPAMGSYFTVVGIPLILPLMMSARIF